MSTVSPSPVRPFRLGTRGSPLALAQARITAEALASHHGLAAGTIEIHTFRTTGDKVQDRPLAELGGKALWTRELDRALLEGDIDFAVHSMKDVETHIVPGIALGAVLPRADPRDRLIGATSIAGLPLGALVGTSSPRREAQLRNLRPDARITLLRGNVETRLRRVAEGDITATFLAAAGLERLGLSAGHALAVEQWLPAASQGVVGIACRAEDEAILALLGGISHVPTRTCLDAERAVLAGLGGSCRTAVAAHARLRDGVLLLEAELFLPDGSERIAASRSGGTAEAMGAAVAQELMSKASPALLATLATLA